MFQIFILQILFFHFTIGDEAITPATEKPITEEPEREDHVFEEGIVAGNVISAPLDDFNLHAGPRDPRGWGKEYRWVNILDATIEGLVENLTEKNSNKIYLIGAPDKPILLVLFDETCDEDIHCKEIQKEFANSKELLNISEHFHMINAKGEDEHNQHWDPMIVNPWYTPRFFFLEDHVSNFKQYIKLAISS